MDATAKTRRSGISLVELRRRTDQQLALLVRGELERALDLARGNRPLEARAKLKEALDLLALASVPDVQLAELTMRINEVEAALAWPQVFRAAS